VLSAHDCAEGGLAVTLAECTFDSNGIGVEVDVASAGDGLPEGWSIDATLFGESPSRVVVSTGLNQVDALLAAAGAARVPAAVIGTTRGGRVVISVAGRPAIDVAVADAEQIWATALGRYFARQAA
jgi:phosphoribosylformylglycinamidine synthase